MTSARARNGQRGEWTTPDACGATVVVRDNAVEVRVGDALRVTFRGARGVPRGTRRAQSQEEEEAALRPPARSRVLPPVEYWDPAAHRARPAPPKPRPVRRGRRNRPESPSSDADDDDGLLDDLLGGGSVPASPAAGPASSPAAAIPEATLSAVSSGAAAASPTAAAAAAAEPLWVMCDRCEQWRRLPPMDPGLLPKQWFCEMNPVLAYSTCAVPQEPERAAAPAPGHAPPPESPPAPERRDEAEPVDGEAVAAEAGRGTPAPAAWRAPAPLLEGGELSAPLELHPSMSVTRLGGAAHPAGYRAVREMASARDASRLCRYVLDVAAAGVYRVTCLDDEPLRPSEGATADEAWAGVERRLAALEQASGVPRARPLGGGGPPPDAPGDAQFGLSHPAVRRLVSAAAPSPPSKRRRRG